LATFAEGATAGGWVDSIGSNSFKRSILDLPEDLADNAGIPFGPLEQKRHVHYGWFPVPSSTDYPHAYQSGEGFRTSAFGVGAMTTSWSPMQTDAGLTNAPVGTQCGQSTGQRLTSTQVAGGISSSRRIFFRGGHDDHQTTGLPAEYAPLPASVTNDCSGYSDPWLCRPGRTDFYYGAISDGVTFSPTCSNPSQTVRLGAVSDPAGSVDVFPTAYVSSAGGNFENRTRYRGSSTLDGANALHTKWSTFAYANDRQQVVTEEEPSALPTSPGQRATTTRQYDSTGRLLATVRTGNTRDPGSGAIVTKHRAIFYRYGARCSGWTEGISRRRVSSVEGPCEVASPAASSCSSGQPAWAVTDLYYYDYANGSVSGALIQNPYDAHNDGRLGATRFFPNGCSGSYLQTQLGSYTAEGKPELVVNPDGTVESSTSSGQLTTYSSGTAPALGTALALQWDMGRLQKATHDNGEYWRACYGRASYASPPESVGPDDQGVWFPYCPKSGAGWWDPATVMDKPLWLGRFNPNGTPLEHYRFFYSADDTLARVEFFADLPTDPYATHLDRLSKRIWWRDIRTDSERRVVASVLGGKIPSLLRRDNRGDVALLGAGFDFANPLMPSAIPFSCDGQGGWLCRQLAIDRLHRPTAITFPYLGGNADSQDCLAYDGQGNVSVYAPGCAPGTCAANPPPTTVSVQAGALSVVGGPTCSATPVWYVHDDFGNLVSVTQTHGSTQSETRFDFDGRNALVQRQTAVQRATNTKTTFATDAAGRTLAVQEFQPGAGAATLVSYAYDVAPPLPANCATAFGSITYGTGRLVYESNPLWKTWNSYDSLGNLKAQLRLSVSQSDCGTVRQDQNWNITRYSYGYRGRLEEVQYPFGRRVKYVYPSSTAGETRRLDLPSGIDVEVFQSETSSSLVKFLDNITWTRDGLLSSYRAYTYQSRPADGALPTYKHTVSYDYAGGSDIETPPASCSGSVAGGSDGTRRLRRIRTVTDNWGRTLDQWYTWIADQVVSVDRCYYGQSTPMNEYRRETGERGFDGKGQLTDTTVVTSGGGLTDSGRFFAYDSRGNRVRLGNHSTLPAPGFSNTHTGDELVSAQAATVTASGATVDSTSRAHSFFSYDQDGRTTMRSAANDTTGLPNWQTSYTFPYGAGATNGGYDSIIRAVTVGGLAYNYYYDGSNRRIRKSYPVAGATDDFFYDSAGRLVSERSFTFDINSNGNTVDEYVYLNGHAVGMLRSVFSGAMQRYGDWDGYLDPTNGAQCQRRAQEGRCGWYWLNPDRLGRPTMVVDKNHRHDGFGEYDVFGMPNRVVRRSETPHPYAANSSYTVATQQTREKFYYRLLARARFDFYESKSRIYSCGQFVFCTSEDILQVAEPGYTPVFQIGATRGALVTPWFAVQSTAGFNVTFTTDASKQGDGVVFSGWDYQRIDPVPTGTTKAMLVFPALRAPGQYHDEETGLFENNNRYYDPSIGRYLSPEPLLQSPAYVRHMAESGLSVPTYAYALNNPLRYVDVDGLKPGDAFRSGEAAAVDALNWVSDNYAEGVEWGGSVYRGANDSMGRQQWYASEPVTDWQAHDCTPSNSPPPSGIRAAAYYHTHPTSPFFSREDKDTTKPDAMRRPDGSIVLGVNVKGQWFEKPLQGPRPAKRIVLRPRALESRMSQSSYPGL
jgi:RHS repeat-associated protein